VNRLYYGDNLDILRKKIRDETVDLCYIDPPFNSKRNYNQIYNNLGTEDRAQARRSPIRGDGTIWRSRAIRRSSGMPRAVFSPSLWNSSRACELYYKREVYSRTS
jgi:DNA modification methylase